MDLAAFREHLKDTDASDNTHESATEKFPSAAVVLLLQESSQPGKRDSVLLRYVEQSASFRLLALSEVVRLLQVPTSGVRDELLAKLIDASGCMSPAACLAEVETAGGPILGWMTALIERYLTSDGLAQWITMPKGTPQTSSATLKAVFEEVARARKVQMHWLVVNAKAMNVDHNPRDEFERNAAQSLASGKREVDLLEHGVYRYAGAITLSSGCLKCHLPNRTSTKDRAAGLVITMPVRGAVSGGQ